MIRITSGTFRGRRIKTSPQKTHRPTSEKIRAAIFDMCGDISEKTFLDLFAGTGAMGIEALSRGAVSATFVESDRKTGAILKENIANFSLEENSKVYICDFKVALKKIKQPFDILFVDAPYDLYKKIAPLLLQEMASLMHEESWLFLEDRGEIEYSEERLKVIKTKKYGNTQVTLLRKQ